MAPHTSGSILVIDDELSIVRALARLLQRDGYMVATARNGRHALAALQAQHYDVILCDLRMPELDGRAFYAHLRQRAPALCQRVIFLTAESSAGDHQAFLAQCGQPWLDKPYPVAALRRTIEQVLARAILAQQLSGKVPGTTPAEARAVGQSPGLVCEERALAGPGGPPERQGLGRGPTVAT